MAEDPENKADKPETKGGLTNLQRRVLDEQRLVNEREKVPQEFGGMPERPVESAEPRARPHAHDPPPPQEAPAGDRDQDIQMEGS